MSTIDNLNLNPIKTETRIIELIQSTLEKRGIDGLVIPYYNHLGTLVNIHLAISAIGKENVKLIVTQGNLNSRKSTKEDLAIIKRYTSLPKENIHIIDIENLLQDINKGYQDVPRHRIHASFLKDNQLFNYNLSYVLLRNIIREDFDLQKFTPPTKRAITDKDKFIQRSIAHYKSNIRLTMLLSFLFAETENSSTLGHVNKTEWLLGLFTKFGTSHAADFLPLANLYNTQVVQLAEHFGLKEYYFSQRTDDIPTRFKYFFNLTYQEVDKILVRLEAGITEEEVFRETNSPLEAIKKIAYHYKASEYARKLPLMVD